MAVKLKWWVAGCGGALALAVLAAILIAALWLIWGEVQPPVNTALAVEAPAVVSPGEEFDLRVRVENRRDVHPLRLSEVVLGSGYVEGFEVMSMEPRAAGRRSQPMTRSLSFLFSAEIPAHAAKDFVFHMKAGQTTGTFTGSVDIWEGLCIMSHDVQTRIRPARAVKPAPATPAPAPDSPPTPAAAPAAIPAS